MLETTNQIKSWFTFLRGHWIGQKNLSHPQATISRDDLWESCHGSHWRCFLTFVTNEPGVHPTNIKVSPCPHSLNHLIQIVNASVHITLGSTWLMVYLPFWKILEWKSGWWHSIPNWMESHNPFMFQSTNQISVHAFFSLFLTPATAPHRPSAVHWHLPKAAHWASADPLSCQCFVEVKGCPTG